MKKFDNLIQKFDLTTLAIVGSRARGENGKFSDLDLIGTGKEERFYSFTYLEQFTELHILY